MEDKRIRVSVVSAPANPFKKPKGLDDKSFNMGDVVMTPSGCIGTVIEIQNGYRDRADKWHKKLLYRLNLDHLPGSPQVVFAGWQLRKIDRRLLEKGYVVTDN